MNWKGTSSFGRRLGSRRYASLRAFAAVVGAAYLLGACDGFPAIYEPETLPQIGGVKVHFISMASYSAATLAWKGNLQPGSGTSTDGLTAFDVPETQLGPVGPTEVAVSPEEWGLRPGHWTFEITVRGDGSDVRGPERSSGRSRGCS